MSANTQLSDREKAMEWWIEELDLYAAVSLRDKYHKKVVTAEDIEEIWRKETSPTTTDDATYANEIEKIFSDLPTTVNEGDNLELNYRKLYFLLKLHYKQSMYSDTTEYFFESHWKEFLKRNNIPYIY